MFRILNRTCFGIAKRFLLTESYYCDTLWNERLKGIDCQLTANQLGIKIQADLSKDVPVSPLDYDFLMNKTDEVDVTNVGYIVNIVRNFRRTQPAINIFPSSNHALIRHFLRIDEDEIIVQLLRDRANTGVFLDPVSVSFLLSRFIEQQSWFNAFMAAAEWLLQEQQDGSCQLAVCLSMISCIQAWQHDIWRQPPPPDQSNEIPEDQKEIKVVLFLQPNSFDDHFDLLRDGYRRQLLGKCLVMLCDRLMLNNSDDNDLWLSWKFLGLALHGKWKGLMEFIGELKQKSSSDSPRINERLMEQIDNLMVDDKEIIMSIDQVEQTIKEFRSNCLFDNRDICNDTLQILSNKIPALCEAESSFVQQMYQQFHNHRLSVFAETKRQIEQQEVVERSKKRLIELTEEEELIRYFEKMPEIMYKSWLARRTKEEKKFSIRQSHKEDLENVKRKEKPKFVVQHPSF